MKIKNKSRRQKFFYAISTIGLLILLFFVSRIESCWFSTELLFKTEMIETIKEEVAEVRSARENYFAEIGYGNDGTYDQFRIDLDCLEDLDQRLLFLKNLRNDLKRMIVVADFRFLEQQVNSRKRAIESLKARVFGDESEVILDKATAEIGLDDETKKKLNDFESEIEKILQEVLSDEEVVEIQKREAETRTKFQQATKEFENCAQIYNKVEDCAGELSAWLVVWDDYRALVLELENLAIEKERESTERLAPIEAEIDKLINLTQ